MKSISREVIKECAKYEHSLASLLVRKEIYKWLESKIQRTQLQRVKLC